MACVDTINTSNVTTVTYIDSSSTKNVEIAGDENTADTTASLSVNTSGGSVSQSSGSPIPSPDPVVSTESRDNPFIPDGELSKATDEMLKRSTIIRDKFYLDQKEKDEKERRERELAGIDSTENVEKSPVQESIVSPVSSQPAQASAKGSQPARAEVKPRMRENGKVEDTVSPEGIKPEVEKGETAPNADGSKTSPDAPDGVNDKEKKKQKKCCSIM